MAVQRAIKRVSQGGSVTYGYWVDSAADLVGLVPPTRTAFALAGPVGFEVPYIYAAGTWYTTVGDAVGPQGIQGERGDAGPTGNTGATGAVGAQGNPGPTGAVGPTGPAGAIGETGRRGAKGDIGPQGDAGPIGETGEAGPMGSQGERGPQGDHGATGPIGPIGPTGSQGPQGPAGSTGATGSAGAQGPQGIQGAKGDTGDTGSQGIQGIQGVKGDTGDTGAQGPQGNAGPNSVSGTTTTTLNGVLKGNGSVVSGSATTADLPDSTDKRYVTDAQRTVIGNTSGVNTGDQDISGKVNTSRQVISGVGLTGGGDLSADRTLAVGAGTGIQVNADDVEVKYGTIAGTAAQGNDVRLSDARTPTAHKTSHQDGGSDEISVTGLSGLLADSQTPLAHKTSHQDGGSDEISVTGLSGLLADAQTPAAHTHPESDIVNLVSDLAGKQPLDSDLTTIAGLTATTDNFMIAASSAWASRTPAQAKTSLALVKGDVGLGNVDNTSDANKPVSTAQQAALDLKAPLASPALTGVPTAPTAAVDTTTTQIATTAMVVGQAGASNPLMDGTVAVGTSKRYSREDHVHPSDTSRVATTRQVISGGGLTGGGDLSADRTLAVGAGTGITVNPDDIAVIYGTTSTSAAVGNDARLSDARTPLAHKVSHQDGGTDEISVTGLSGLLADGQTPLAHATSHKSGGTDAIKLDELAAPTDVTTLDATTSQHGLMRKFPGGTSTFLRADGAFAAVTATVVLESHIPLMSLATEVTI